MARRWMVLAILAFCGLVAVDTAQAAVKPRTILIVPFETSGLGGDAGRLRRVVQHEHQRRRVQLSIIDRDGFQLAFSQLDICAAVQPPLRRGEHRRGVVNADDSAHEGRECFGDAAGAAAEIADGPPGPSQAGQRRQMETVAEQLVAQPIPPAGRRRKERLRPAAAPGERRLQPVPIVS